MAVQVSATFKKDEREYNGLEDIREQLIESPHDRWVIVATVETTQIVTDVRDGGTRTPRVRLVNVEAMHGDAAVIARKLLDEQYHVRTGQTAPPPTLFDPDQPPPGEDDDQGDAPAQGEVLDDGQPSPDGWPGDADQPVTDPASRSGRVFSDPAVADIATASAKRRRGGQ